MTRCFDSCFRENRHTERMQDHTVGSAPQPEKLVELGSEASAHAAAAKELTGGDRCAMLIVARCGAL